VQVVHTDLHAPIVDATIACRGLGHGDGFSQREDAELVPVDGRLLREIRGDSFGPTPR
jgi:hypothetical protein